LKDQSYDDKVVGTWVNYICEDVIQGLNDLGKPFKYIGVWRTLTPRWCGVETPNSLLPKLRAPNPARARSLEAETRVLGEGGRGQ
jgi:hypothetical protein